MSAAGCRHVREWERIVRGGVAALVGPIRQELLSGVRSESEWERLRQALRPFPDLPIGMADYERAAQFFNRCRARGIAGSAIDRLICSAAARYEAPIYTTDSAFRRYASVLELKLKLHVPRSVKKQPG
ncbi:MAG: PIN domain-containing protein [Gammaproteobacteria bacterium]|nr:PIN domain-containing protein [Gammaproteobacteria bacterium]